MIAGLLLSFVVSFAIGWLIVSLFWPSVARGGAAWRLVRMFLAFGIGQGVTSCLAFVCLVLQGYASSRYRVVELVVLACLALAAVLAKRRRAAREPAPGSEPVSPETNAGRSRVLLAAAFYTAAALTFATIALRLWQAPHGGHDAWVIWNARARAIFRLGAAWRDDIYGVIVGHVHLDYPLLLPVGVVRAWIYAGGETTLAPALLAWLFTAATLGLLVSALAVLCGRAHAYTAGLVLLGYSFFMLHANSELAEAPIILFFLAALVLVAFHNEGIASGYGLLVLAGVAAGLAAWTKNEGLLFLPALAVAYFLVAIYTRGASTCVREMLALGAGLLPIAAIILYFKTQLAPPNEWIAGVTAPQFSAQVTEANRYFAIAKEFAQRLLLYDGPGINMAYLLALFMVCFGITRRHLPTVVLTAIVLGIMLTGFVSVYLTTQPNVAAFMAGSIDRLLLELWPPFVFAFFLLTTPVERQTPARAGLAAPRAEGKKKQ